MCGAGLPPSRCCKRATPGTCHWPGTVSRVSPSVPQWIRPRGVRAIQPRPLRRAFGTHPPPVSAVITTPTPSSTPDPTGAAPNSERLYVPLCGGAPPRSIASRALRDSHDVTGVRRLPERTPPRPAPPRRPTEPRRYALLCAVWRGAASSCSVFTAGSWGFGC